MGSQTPNPSCLPRRSRATHPASSHGASLSNFSSKSLSSQFLPSSPCGYGHPESSTPHHHPPLASALPSGKARGRKGRTTRLTTARSRPGEPGPGRTPRGGSGPCRCQWAESSTKSPTEERQRLRLQQALVREAGRGRPGSRYGGQVESQPRALAAAARLAGSARPLKLWVAASGTLATNLRPAPQERRLLEARGSGPLSQTSAPGISQPYVSRGQLPLAQSAPLEGTRLRDLPDPGAARRRRCG